MYEYGTLKPVEVILRRGFGEEGEQWRGWAKLEHNICIHGNVTMRQLPDTNKNVLKNKDWKKITAKFI
jgi:hypothetical protein